MEIERRKGPSSANPIGFLALFFSIFVVLVLIAFLGYRYIGLASQYAFRNLVHLDAVNSAQDLLHRAPIAGAVPAADIAKLVTQAQDQAVWCLDNLNWVERWFASRIGLSEGLLICEMDIIIGDVALRLLQQIQSLDGARPKATQDAAASMERLSDTLQDMVNDSLEFAPYVEVLRSKLTRLVMVGTLVSSGVLTLLMFLLSYTLMANWRSRSRDEQKMRRQSIRFELAIKANLDGFALFDAERRLLTCNDRFKAFMHPDERAVRPGVSLFRILKDAAEQGFYIGYGKGDGLTFLEDFEAALVMFDSDGMMVELQGDRHVQVSRTETSFGDTLVLVRDLTSQTRADREQKAYAQELRRAHDRIERNARLDPLTNLPNRRALDEALRERISEGQVALVRIDLDRFKQVNDVFGHEAGDYVLTHVADILRQETGGGDLPARVGGDEFVILCASGCTEQEAVDLSERLLRKILEPVVFQGKQCVFGASFGVATSCGDGEDPSGLLSSADAALYKAKEQGRATVEVYTPALKQAAMRDRALSEGLVPALQSAQFKPFGQSIHFAKDWSVAGIEILARWDHPKFGILAPNDFLHVARHMGMEADLDAAIFRAALEELAAVEQDHIQFPRISFNVSAGRLIDPAFHQAVQDELADWKDRVAFEILETISLDQGPEILRGLRALQETGVEVDVDDFGSGHASINSVMKIGPNTIKIDRDIVAPLGFEPHAKKMVATVIEMGKAMDVAIVAEGVETEYQAMFLRDLGAHKLQGYFFSHPMPIRELAAKLRQRVAG